MLETKPAPVWVLYDEKIGSTHQCLGLAQRLGVAFELKRVALKAPWTKRGPHFHLIDLQIVDIENSSDLSAPWPELIIASGSKLVAPALAIKQASGGKTLTVQIHDPVAKRDHFDAIVVPQHDARNYKNFIKINAALTVVNQTRLDEGAAELAPLLHDLPKPWIGLMIGGPNRAFTFPDKDLGYITAPLDTMLDDGQGSLVICPSRRTPSRVLLELQQRYASNPRVWIWDRESNNPYFGILALADQLCVTQDSVNMITEAAGVGFGVTMLPLPRKGIYRFLRSKFDRFQSAMIKGGYARHWSGQLETWQPPKIDDAELVIKELRKRFPNRLSFL